MESWHVYELDWLHSGCRFSVDGQTIMDTKYSPSGPLGFVAWIDNQFMIATPSGRLGWGALPVIESQWLLIEEIELAGFDSQ